MPHQRRSVQEGRCEVSIPFRKSASRAKAAGAASRLVEVGCPNGFRSDDLLDDHLAYLASGRQSDRDVARVVEHDTNLAAIIGIDYTREDVEKIIHCET